MSRPRHAGQSFLHFVPRAGLTCRRDKITNPCSFDSSCPLAHTLLYLPRGALRSGADELRVSFFLPKENHMNRKFTLALAAGALSIAGLSLADEPMKTPAASTTADT